MNDRPDRESEAERVLANLRKHLDDPDLISERFTVADVLDWLEEK